MSDIYVDWSKAPEGTTHVYVGIVGVGESSTLNLVNGLPLNPVQWEKHIGENVYDWVGYEWRSYNSLKAIDIKDRIARPIESLIPLTKVNEETIVISRHCKIKKLRESAKLPLRATPTAAGYDVTWSSAFGDDEESFVNIGPGRVTQLGTGLAFELPPDVAMLVLPRSGLATKRRLRPANTPGLVDSDYRGELIVALENFGDSPQKIHPGDRIAQIIFINPLQMNFEEVDELSSTERGEGGFGSTGS